MKYLIFLFYFLGPVILTAQDSNKEISLKELLSLLDQGESIEGFLVEMNEVSFDFASTSLTSETKNYLDNIVLLLVATPNLDLVISGHTDNVGNAKTNLDLSRRRAKSVYDYLIKKNIDKNRLSYIGYGNERPITKNDNQEGNSRNRRVEFEIVRRESLAEEMRIQDVIYLKDGSRLGAYDLELKEGLVYYKSFIDNMTKSRSIKDVAYLKYANGKVDQLQSNAFIGDWVNVDKATPSITKFTISPKGEGMTVRMWGACSPSDCDWGTQNISLFDAADQSITLMWDPGFAESNQIIENIGNDRLKVTTKTRFKDGSGRGTNSTVNYFEKSVRSNVNEQKKAGNNSGEWEVSSAYLNSGYRSWSLEGSSLAFEFTDDSPSMDNLTNQVDLNRSGLTWGFGLEWSGKGKDFILGLEGFMGKVRGVGLVTGLGYQLIQKPNYILRLGITAYLGREAVKLGELENNDLFIQINDQEFYSEYVSVKLIKPVSTLQPHIVYDFKRNDNAYIRFELGYSLEVYAGSERLQFEGSGDEVDIVESKDLSSANARFTINGKTTDLLPIELTGLYFKLGWVIR